MPIESPEINPNRSARNQRADDILVKRFEGLSLVIRYGEINLPEDAVVPNLGNDVLDKTIRFATGDLKIFINKPLLNQYLLEIGGHILFRALDGRFIVVARVGNIHLPFYISSMGTGGKRAGGMVPILWVYRQLAY